MLINRMKSLASIVCKRLSNVNVGMYSVYDSSCLGVVSWRAKAERHILVPIAKAERYRKDSLSLIDVVSADAETPVCSESSAYWVKTDSFVLDSSLPEYNGYTVYPGYDFILSNGSGDIISLIEEPVICISNKTIRGNNSSLRINWLLACDLYCNIELINNMNKMYFSFDAKCTEHKVTLGGIKSTYYFFNRSTREILIANRVNGVIKYSIIRDKSNSIFY